MNGYLIMNLLFVEICLNLKTKRMMLRVRISIS